MAIPLTHYRVGQDIFIDSGEDVYCNSLIGKVDTLVEIKKKKMNTEVQDKGE